MVSKNVYIGGSDAHDQPAGPQNAPELMVMHPPATATMPFFSLQLLQRNHVRPKVGLQCFSSIRKVVDLGSWAMYSIVPTYISKATQQSRPVIDLIVHSILYSMAGLDSQ